MAEITNYQCPACNAPLHFDSDSARLICDYCSSSFTAEEVDEFYAQKNAKASQEASEADLHEDNAEEAKFDFNNAHNEWDSSDVKAYNCPSCGAQLICSATAATLSCPYCGNNAIVPGNLSGAVKPDYVIPFKLDKEAAMAALRKHYKGKLFLPNSFKTENQISQIRGMYVPFWLFDCSVAAKAGFRATRTHSRVQGKYRITTTDHFDVARAGTMAFSDIPVDASESMPDAHMDSIEPFDYSGLLPFKNAYLAGYIADRYDVSANESFPRADERARESALEVLRNTVSGYDSVSLTWQNVSISKGEAKYAFLPVWMLNTKWKDKDFLFAMNAQTGKLVGNMPTSFLKLLLWFLGVAAASTIVLSLIFTLI